MCQNSEYDRALNVRALQAFWICQNMPWQSSEYILGSKYVRILNMAGCWIYKNYTGFLICCNVAEYVWKRQITEQVSRQMHSEHCQKFKMECFAKRTIPECKCLTRNFSGHWGKVVKLGQEGPQGNILGFLS